MILITLYALIVRYVGPQATTLFMYKILMFGPKILAFSRGVFASDYNMNSHVVNYFIADMHTTGRLRRMVLSDHQLYHISHDHCIQMIFLTLHTMRLCKHILLFSLQLCFYNHILTYISFLNIALYVKTA